MRYLPEPKKFRLPQTVATVRIMLKICHGQPPTMCLQCSRFHPNLLTFGGVIAECVNTDFLPRRAFPFQYGGIRHPG